ncbi:hypothetical protein SUGI_1144940 [Cryptomeria japonica]|nr:hypothetical protein SUGI_1144940 [Cryptomeria japonica]
MGIEKRYDAEEPIRGWRIRADEVLESTRPTGSVAFVQKTTEGCEERVLHISVPAIGDQHSSFYGAIERPLPAQVALLRVHAKIIKDMETMKDVNDIIDTPLIVPNNKDWRLEAIGQKVSKISNQCRWNSTKCKQSWQEALNVASITPMAVSSNEFYVGILFFVAQVLVTEMVFKALGRGFCLVFFNFLEEFLVQFSLNFLESISCQMATMMRSQFWCHQCNQMIVPTLGDDVCCLCCNGGFVGNLEAPEQRQVEQPQ